MFAHNLPGKRTQIGRILKVTHERAALGVKSVVYDRLGAVIFLFHYISRESYATQNVYWSRASACVSVCQQPRAHTAAWTRM